MSGPGCARVRCKVLQSLVSHAPAKAVDTYKSKNPRSCWGGDFFLPYKTPPVADATVLLCLANFFFGHECPCKNWSTAPAAAPCFVHWTRSPPLPAKAGAYRIGAAGKGRSEKTRSPFDALKVCTSQELLFFPAFERCDFFIWVQGSDPGR